MHHGDPTSYSQAAESRGSIQQAEEYHGTDLERQPKEEAYSEPCSKTDAGIGRPRSLKCE